MKGLTGELYSLIGPVKPVRRNKRVQIVQELLRHLCWSFWQSAREFPAESLRQYMEQTIQGMGA